MEALFVKCWTENPRVKSPVVKVPFAVQTSTVERISLTGKFPSHAAASAPVGYCNFPRFSEAPHSARRLPPCLGDDKMFVQLHVEEVPINSQLLVTFYSNFYLKKRYRESVKLLTQYYSSTVALFFLSREGEKKTRNWINLDLICGRRAAFCRADLINVVKFPT